MSKPLCPIALFRLMILGPLASRGELQRGEVKSIVRELAAQKHAIPDSRRVHISEATILRWYYDWKRGGIEALSPSERNDKGKTKVPEAVQSALLRLKQDNPARSINTLIQMLESQGIVVKNQLARATVHRFLKRQQLSQRILPNKQGIERRSFVAAHAGDIWQGDVLHGPAIQTADGMRKTYLVSLMDDASRLIVHSAFCLGETALDIEGVLKQAILKRGLPRKLVIDNGPAYRSASLQAICARLEIRLIYCRAYEPEAKGKLERFHRTFREQFLAEIVPQKIGSLDELNALLWAWLEQVYHQRPHEGLSNQTPIERWRQDLIQMRQLAPTMAHHLADIFCHRFKRRVRKDGTVSWEGQFFEVPHGLNGQTLQLVVDPHAQTALKVESLLGDYLGSVTPLDKNSNLHRKRQRPTPPAEQQSLHLEESAVVLAYQAYQARYHLSSEEK